MADPRERSGGRQARGVGERRLPVAVHGGWAVVVGEQRPGDAGGRRVRRWPLGGGGRAGRDAPVRVERGRTAGVGDGRGRSRRGPQPLRREAAGAGADVAVRAHHPVRVSARPGDGRLGRGRIPVEHLDFGCPGPPGGDPRSGGAAAVDELRRRREPALRDRPRRNGHRPRLRRARPAGAHEDSLRRGHHPRLRRVRPGDDPHRRAGRGHQLRVRDRRGPLPERRDRPGGRTHPADLGRRPAGRGHRPGGG